MELIHKMKAAYRTGKNGKDVPPVFSRGSNAGVVLLDGSGNLISANAVAAKIILYPESDPPTQAVAAKKICLRLLQPGSAAVRRPSFVTEIRSGRRLYACQTFALRDAHQGTERCYAVILERKPPKNPSLHHVVDRFGLTQRQRQTVELLMKGLTSKEMAASLGVSPNTVKSLVRVIKSKMGVSTRSAILGKMFQQRNATWDL